MFKEEEVKSEPAETTGKDKYSYLNVEAIDKKATSFFK
jgi:hypothetical protein